METVMTTPVVVTDMKRKVQDILMSVSWRDFANTYFQKSSSWFYHKMDGIDGNGGAGGFNQQETEQMRGRTYRPIQPHPSCSRKYLGEVLIDLKTKVTHRLWVHLSLSQCEGLMHKIMKNLRHAKNICAKCRLFR